MSEVEKPNILLVDDRSENLLALEGVLEDENYTLLKATSGQEALRLVLKHDVDLILLDVQMPEMDGFEVAKLLRSKKKTEAIPIIFITAITIHLITNAFIIFWITYFNPIILTVHLKCYSFFVVTRFTNNSLGRTRLSLGFLYNPLGRFLYNLLRGFLNNPFRGFLYNSLGRTRFSFGRFTNNSLWRFNHFILYYNIKFIYIYL